MFGPIVDRVQETSDRSARTGSIIRFIWHHAASDNELGTVALFQPGGREVSANYCVGTLEFQPGRARIWGIVDEAFRAWTSGSPKADGRALTCEVVNSTAGPEWGISQFSLESCAILAAYAYNEYKVPLERANAGNGWRGHMGHNEVASAFGEGYATFCPGNLWIDWVIERAKQLVNGQGHLPSTPLQPTPSVEPTTYNGTFDIPWNHWYGDITGPNESHGGYYAAERPAVAKIQARLEALGYLAAGNVTGEFRQSTIDAVAAWQRDNMPGTQYYGQVWMDDWEKLFSDTNTTATPTVPAPAPAPYTPPPVSNAGGLTFPFGGADYFGDINGPAESHGGYYENERPYVAAIQNRLIDLGYAGTQDRRWADGLYEQPTVDAVAAWQRDAQAQGHYMIPEGFGRIYSDDWARLFS